MKIKIDSIQPNPQQPRAINLEKLENLTASIQQVGLINPIAVENNGDGTYTLIDGEHRWRACKAAGLEFIEAYVKDSRNGNSDSARLAEATSANMQRADMNVIEQARAIERLFKMGYSMDEVKRITGLSQNPILLRRELLTFSPVIQELFEKGALPIGTRLIYAIRNTPIEQRDEIFTRFATRKFTEAKMLAALSFMASNRQGRRRRPKEAMDQPCRPCRGALDVTTNLNVPEILKTNVTAVCERCGMASRPICSNCPVTDLVDHWK